MAHSFTTEHKRGHEYLFYPDEIVIRPEDNGRLKAGDPEPIRQSFRKHGQLQPVGIVVEGKKPILKMGFTRWQAAMLENEGVARENQMRLRCVVVSGSAIEQMAMNIHENIIRNEPTLLDHAYNIARLERQGQTEEEIAGIFLKDVKWVRKTKKLLNLTEEGKAAYQNGKIVESAALKIAKMSSEEQLAALRGTKGKKKEDEGEEVPVRPNRKQIIEQLQIAEGSPALDAGVRRFARKFLKFMDDVSVDVF